MTKKTKAKKSLEFYKKNPLDFAKDFQAFKPSKFQEELFLKIQRFKNPKLIHTRYGLKIKESYDQKD